MTDVELLNIVGWLCLAVLMLGFPGYLLWTELGLTARYRAWKRRELPPASFVPITLKPVGERERTEIDNTHSNWPPARETEGGRT